MKKIMISAGGITLPGELNDTPTAEKIGETLPLQGIAATWGDEIYFEIPVDIEQDPEARADVEVGTLGYWPPGHAFCIFFGRTPASTGERPRAAGPVNIVGKVIGDATRFRTVQSGAIVHLEHFNNS